MDLLQPIAAVFLVLALLAVALFLLKRRGLATIGTGLWASPGTRRMELVDRLALGPQHALHLVRVDGQPMLVATSPSSCQLLADGETLPGVKP